MQELKGKHVWEVRLGDAATLLVFYVATPASAGRWNGEYLAYRTNGDCCSETWFSAINGATVLDDQTVIDVVEREAADAPGTRQDEDQIYGYTLVTAKGHCDIEFRNSSNGYYGGSCYRIDFDPGEHGGHWAQLAPVTDHYALI